MGVSLRALSRDLSVCLGAREHRREARSSTSFPHQEYRRSSFARAPSRPQIGDRFLRGLRLALVSRHGSPGSWLRKSAFEANRKISRKLLIRHPVVVLGLTLKLHDSRRLGLCLAKAKFVSSPRSFVTPGGPNIHDAQLSRRKYNRLIAP